MKSLPIVLQKVAMEKVAISAMRLYAAGLSRANSLNREAMILRNSSKAGQLSDQAGVLLDKNNLLNKVIKSYDQVDNMLPSVISRDVRAGSGEYSMARDAIMGRLSMLKNNLTNN